MGNDFNTTFTADDKDILKTFERQQRELEKLQNTVRKLNEDSKKGGQDSASSLKGTISYVTSLVGSYVALSKVASAVTSEYEKQAASLRENATSARTLSEQFLRLLTTSGMLANAPDLKKFLGGLGVDESVAQSALAGATNAPGFRTLEEIKELTRLGTKLSPVEGDPMQFTQSLAQLFAAQGKRGSLDDTADRLLIARQFMGNQSGQLSQLDFANAHEQLIQSGMGREFSMAAQIIGAQKGISSELMEKVANAVKGQSAVTGQSPEELFMSAVRDENVARRFDPVLSRKVFGQLRGNEAAIEDIRNQLGQADERNVVNETLGLARNTPEGILALDRARKSAEDNEKNRLRGLWSEMQSATDAAITKRRDERGVPLWLRGIGRMIEGPAQGVRDALANNTDLDAQREAMISRFDLAAGDWKLGELVDGNNPTRLALINKLDALVQSLQGNTIAINHNNRLQPRGPAAGDVDRHMEQP